ncbi:MAG: hypothetical protein QXD09_05465 [Candidatus Caldarchaeum sp.]
MSFEVDVETWCPAYRVVVRLTLASDNPRDVKGNVVAGKPVRCNFEGACGKRDDIFCMLKSVRIETRRR